MMGCLLGVRVGKSSLHVKEAGLKIQFQDGEPDFGPLRSFRLSIGQNPFFCQIVRHFRIAFYLVKFA